jgi:hypothetical protein
MEADTCLEGAKTCHVNSQCVDFATGFCCGCMEPFYGNGLNCLKPSMYCLIPYTFRQQRKKYLKLKLSFTIYMQVGLFNLKKHKFWHGVLHWLYK